MNNAPNYSRTVQSPEIGHFSTLKEAQKHAPNDSTMIVFHHSTGYIPKTGEAYPAPYTVICTRKNNGKWSRRRDHLPYGKVKTRIENGNT